MKMINVPRTWLASALAAAVGCGVAGCNRSEQADHTPPPEQVPTVPAPVSTPKPATLPAAPEAMLPSYLYIKEVPDPRKSQSQEAASNDPSVWGPSVQFARARLAIVGRGGHALTAKLYSDDGKAALKDNWTGDRYLFVMPLQINDRNALNGYRYRWKTAYEGVEEAPDGIYLRGDNEHIEPVDLDVQFEIVGGTINIWLGGLFKQTDPVQGETRWYHVRGILYAAME